MKKTVEEITQFFVDKFTEPHYYIRKGRELYVIKGFKNRNDVPIVDDGSIVGVDKACLNFFPFRRRNENLSPAEWLFNDYVSWLPGSASWPLNSDMDLRLRRYYSYSFVHWLMKKYPDVVVHDVRGRKLELPRPGTIIG